MAVGTSMKGRKIFFITPYFTKNKIRGVGDILTITADADLVRDIGVEVRRGGQHPREGRRGVVPQATVDTNKTADAVLRGEMAGANHHAALFASASEVDRCGELRFARTHSTKSPARYKTRLEKR